MVEPIDVALDAFKALRPELQEYSASIQTEEDTRLKVINRVLVDVLMWPYDSISTEVPSAGGFADYSLSVNERARLIIEAKKDGRDLGCQGRNAGRGYRLSGGVFSSEAVKEGIGQAIRYCSEHSAELACVTNGREWIVFRGSRLGDGTLTRQGMAFVFSDLSQIEDNFKLFYSLLSYETAGTFGYRAYFQEAEGQPIRKSVFHKSVRAKGSARLIRAGDLYSDLDKVMINYFQRLTGEGNEGMLEACFVESNESQRAERQLVRITEDVVNRVKDIETGTGEQLTRVIQNTGAMHKHEFVIIVGTKGAGKSTFLARFFSRVLPMKIKRDVVVARVDLGRQSGDYGTLTAWLNTELIGQLEQELFNGTPGYEDLQGMFFDEYKRLMLGSWKVLYETNKIEFQVRFGDRIEAMRSERSTQYIAGLLRHVINSRLKLPVLVFDNADHFDIPFQQRVYQYARALYEQSVCLVILPITDRTSWQLSKEGAFQSFENEAFFLPAPRTEEVIRKRIEYLSELVELERTTPHDRYSIAGNLYITLDDLSTFARTLQRVFLQDSNVSRWIGELANFNVRRTLDLARLLVSSPHLKVEDLVKAYMSGTTVDVPDYRATNALIRQKYDIYPVGQNEYVQNIYSMNEDLSTSPLLGLRVLQLLSDVPRDERRAALLNVDDLVAYCAGMAIEPSATYLWLQALLDTQLVLNYDPTVTDVKEARQVEISPSGRLHLYWGQGNHDYMAAMALVTPLLTENVFTEMLAESRNARAWRSVTAKFVRYLLEEDRTYCVISDHEAYQSQKKLCLIIERSADRLENWTSHAQRQPRDRKVDDSAGRRGRPPRVR